MDKSIWDERRRGLEEEYFRKQNQELINKIQEKLALEKTREELSTFSGIKDDAVLAKLAEAKITPDTMVALSMVPLVHVAWADGRLDPEEREAILDAAADDGISLGSAPHALLCSWLEAPNEGLFATWRYYIAALESLMDPDAFKALGTIFIERAKLVAESSGGVLRIGSISPVERRALDHLGAIFGL